MLKTIYPFAFVLRDLDNIVSLETGCVEAEDEHQAFNSALTFAQSKKNADSKIKSVEILKVGDPRPIND